MKCTAAARSHCVHFLDVDISDKHWSAKYFPRVPACWKRMVTSGRWSRCSTCPSTGSSSSMESSTSSRPTEFLCRKEPTSSVPECASSGNLVWLLRSKYANPVEFQLRGLIIFLLNSSLKFNNLFPKHYLQIHTKRWSPFESLPK